MRKLLKKITLFPSLRLVLILNNTVIHYTIKISELCEIAGIKVEYLPLYSLDISPIEPIFLVLKSWIRRNR